MDECDGPDTPGTNGHGILTGFQGRPLLSAGPYYTLPAPLLRQVIAEVGQERFDAELLEMEFALSDACADHTSEIGSWRGTPINFLLLRPKNDLTTDFFVEGMAAWGKSEEEARAILNLASQRLDWTADVRRGYCGWLMTNRTFLDEHCGLVQRWADELAQNGVPRMGPVVRDAQAYPGAERGEGELERFVREFEEFFVRWRLDGMPAPWVPQPMAAHVPVCDLRPVLGHMRHGGTTVYFPDICPLPTQEELRKMLEDAVRNREAPDYLAEWFGIVQSGNAAKNQIARYGRVFEVQHYMRALYARHATALERKKSSLIVALAEFFDVSDDSIERDLSRIDQRLGPEWYLAPA